MPLTRTREMAFTLVEVLIVMIIIALIMGIGAGMMESAKRSARHQQATTLARTYFNAAVDFSVDNGGTAPRPGTADWPTNQFERGPVNTLQRDAGQRYLAGIPESASSPEIAIRAGSRPPVGPRVAVTFQLLSAMTFATTGWVDGRAVCQMSNQPAASVTLPSC